MPQIDVYRKRDGKKVRVPAHWMEHRVLSKPFRKTPLQKAADRAEAAAASSTANHETPAAGDEKGK
jgi:hypothetical protein